MSTPDDGLAELVAEFRKALEGADPAALEHWKGAIGEAVRLMLGYDSGGVLWAIGGCEPLEFPEEAAAAVPASEPPLSGPVPVSETEQLPPHRTQGELF